MTQPSGETWLLSGGGVKSDLITQSLPLPRSQAAYASTQLHFDYGRDVFLIREAVVGGERGGGAGQVHLSQAASLPVLLPPPRERSTAVTGKLHCPERGGLHSSPPYLPPSLMALLFAASSPETPLHEDETNQRLRAAVQSACASAISNLFRSFFMLTRNE